MCVPSLNFVGLIVPEKIVTKILKFENWKEKLHKGMNTSSSLILVYTIHQAVVHVCTKY